tara:strand:+ start:4622 stop:4837 length:216 start_codon:yes stop_codon:yes gene_type:complete
VATSDHKSLSPMDIVAVLAMVTKDQQSKLAQEISQKDAEIAALKNRTLQLETVVVEVLRLQSSDSYVSLTN